MWQRFFVAENRTEIAHIKPTAARFAFVKVCGLAQWRSARLLADDRPARDRRMSPDVTGEGRLGFVVVGVLDREQDTLIGFIGKLPQ
jgi:hypothetical protein